MGTTTKLALPYPEATDPADIPLDMNELASRIDTVAGTASGLATLDAGGKVPAAQLPAAAGTGYGTTLPASPTDGQEHILVNSLTNPAYQWRFRYNAGSSSAYKWEFVGGSDLFGGPSGSVTGITTTPTPLTGGPSLVVPHAGDYLVMVSVFGQATAYTSACNLQAAVNLSTSGAGQLWIVSVAIALNMGATSGGREKRTGLVAGETATIRVVNGNANATGSYSSGSLSLLPVRIS